MTKVVVTGASGVVGSAVLKRLSSDETIQVVALTRQALSPDSGDYKEIWHQTDYSLSDLNNYCEGASSIIHLAGVKGDKTDLSDFESDITMTQNLLNSAVECGVKKFIYSSSRLVYVNPDLIPWNENTVPSPDSAYAINKLRTEELCFKYSEDFGIQVFVARIAQVISANDTMRNMVNIFRDLAISGQELTVIGKSVARRQYIYAHDLAEILYRFLQLETRKYEIVNIGMPKAYTNIEIARAFNNAYKNEAPIIYDDSMPETITASQMDVQKMLSLTGYMPMDLEHALQDMAKNAQS